MSVKKINDDDDDDDEGVKTVLNSWVLSDLRKASRQVLTNLCQLGNFRRRRLMSKQRLTHNRCTQPKRQWQNVLVQNITVRRGVEITEAVLPFSWNL